MDRQNDAAEEDVESDIDTEEKFLTLDDVSEGDCFSLSNKHCSLALPVATEKICQLMTT